MTDYTDLIARMRAFGHATVMARDLDHEVAAAIAALQAEE